MTGLTELWMPILLSAVLVFLVSSVIHMASPWHKNDYQQMPHEREVMDALRPLAIPPGDYIVPRAGSMQVLRSPEYLAQLNAGPVMVVTVMPNGMTSMSRNLSMWFVYAVVVGIFSAYVAGRGNPHGTSYLQVFRFVGATAFVGYTLAIWQMSIWYRRAWSTTIKATIDGLIYASLTAGAFGWLWPR